MQAAPLEVFGGNATNLEDKFLSYKDDNSMSAWIHVSLIQTAGVLLYPFANSAVKS